MHRKHLKQCNEFKNSLDCNQFGRKVKGQKAGRLECVLYGISQMQASKESRELKATGSLVETKNDTPSARHWLRLKQFLWRQTSKHGPWSLVIENWKSVSHCGYFSPLTRPCHLFKLPIFLDSFFFHFFLFHTGSFLSFHMQVRTVLPNRNSAVKVKHHMWFCFWATQMLLGR